MNDVSMVNKDSNPKVIDSHSNVNVTKGDWSYKVLKQINANRK